MGVTIKDVAKQAGVSVATVSRVINRVPNINEEMKQSVLKSIDELGYKPNQLAKGLKNNITKTVGLIASDISDPFIMGVTRAAEKVLRAEGYSILMASTDNDEAKEEECIDMMASKCVDGLIICPTCKDIAPSLSKLDCSIVSFDRNILNNIFDTVYVDKEKAMYDAIAYLINKGHTNIAMITGEKKLSTNYDRYNGYMRAFFDYDKVAQKGNLLFGSFSKEFGMQAIEQLMTRDNPPTAIVSGSATITLGILIKAHEMNISIPEDVSLVAFGTLEFQSLIEPAITHAKEMQEEVGNTVGNMLLTRLTNKKLHERLQVFESAIIEGNSVKDIN